MNKVEFDKDMNLTVNGEIINLEQIFCAMMRRRASIPGIGPGTWKHFTTTFSALEWWLQDAADQLEHERENHPQNPANRK